MIFDTNEDIFEVLGISEEWEDEEENLYVREDNATLKEYGYIR